MDAHFTFSKSVTDERMIIDIPLPGLTKRDVTVKRVDLDRMVRVKIRSTVEKKDTFGFYKKLVGYKDDKQFIVDPERFNLDQMDVSLDNGVLRISIPKTQAAIGQTVFGEDENPDD
jgi:HSP20 family molecular chaperone IbpA